MAKEKIVVIEYHEDMGDVFKDDKGREGLVVWLKDSQTGEKNFVCSNVFRRFEGQEGNDACAMHFSLFKEAIELHEKNGYPIIWV